RGRARRHRAEEVGQEEEGQRNGRRRRCRRCRRRRRCRHNHGGHAMTQVWEDAITSTLATLSNFMERSWPEFLTREELVSHLGEVDQNLDPQLVTARVQKSVLALA